jgi:hypothetical protein
MTTQQLVINEIFGKDIGGIIFEYSRPRTLKEIKVDIEKIRTTHMCPECKEVIDKGIEYIEDPSNYVCCINFDWREYDYDLCAEYAKICRKV